MAYGVNARERIARCGAPHQRFRLKIDDTQAMPGHGKIRGVKRTLIGDKCMRFEAPNDRTRQQEIVQGVKRLSLASIPLQSNSFLNGSVLVPTSPPHKARRLSSSAVTCPQRVLPKAYFCWTPTNALLVASHLPSGNVDYSAVKGRSFLKDPGAGLWGDRALASPETCMTQ